MRYAIRSLLRDRAFALMVVLSLAVGIGANTAIFSLVNGVLLRPPGYPAPHRLMAVTLVAPRLLKSYPALPVNIALFYEWRKQITSFEDSGMWRSASFNLTGGGPPEQVRGGMASAGMFRVLGVVPQQGRLFTDDEDTAGHDVVLMTDSLWRRRYHADPNIAGSKILVEGTPCTVAGVLPAHFQYPSATEVLFTGGPRDAELFKPIGYKPDDLVVSFGDLNYWPVARLRPGVPVARAQAELNLVQADLTRKWPEEVRASLTPLQDRLVGDSRRGLILIMCAVGAVLLVLCVNLANLSLARVVGRARDTAIRTALGAGRARLVWQSLLESTVLASAGGALGIALAWAGVKALVGAAPADLPRVSEATLDARVLGFAVAVSLLTGLIFGVLPALRLARQAPFETLKSGSRGATESRRGLRVRNLLVGLEVGLSAALLVTAGLLMASFLRLMNIDRGFNVDRVLALNVSLLSTKYPDVPARAAFYRLLLEKSSGVPGVQSASIVSALPLTGETWIDIIGTENDTRPFAELPSTNVRFISPGYFRTLNIPLREGRDFTEQDRNRNAVIISSSLARRLWGDVDPLGRRLKHGNRVMEVIGVTPDVRGTSLDHEPVNMLYDPYWDRTRLGASLLVRTAMDPRTIVGELRKAIWQIDAEVTIPQVRTMEDVMSRSVAQRRFQMMLVLIFAAAALSLAAIGAYGVLSYAVNRRTAEMGIRMALGAARIDVLRMILLQGMAPVFGGLIIGGAAALAVGRYLESLLFQVSPRDPAAFAVSSAVLIAVSAAACFIPARRATRVNPVDALRIE
ncbi:MAG TPA: ABC transporter permease [Candidatus Acidoferrales bacterium]|nr:ABC transporter permease [Candidatus Acidoferrales bacterium]